ncbi:serine/threonine-protein kinase dst4-like [Paramacrobiotus metropolitanus]|uniref:serine/threonine-protein kinase dst4-like n=1 Tax=Paramacrobiotus metropolitanus TaxID=2943436 RepID=UPI0024464C6E|nr:serine/threonine-protein kinase dst4-like [Paramacrobiotus metropolitanus]
MASRTSITSHAPNSTISALAQLSTGIIQQVDSSIATAVTTPVDDRSTHGSTDKSSNSLTGHWDIEKFRPQFTYNFDREKSLGTGGQSHGVYAATPSAANVQPGKFAVKCINPRDSNLSTNEAIKQIIKEFKTIIGLDSPNNHLVKYHYLDWGMYSDAQELRILMEYCEGGSLSEKNEKLEKAGQRYSQSEIVRDFTGILNGLAFLHDKRIVHRDLKGQNILFTADGTAKIADFGISVQLAGMTTGSGDAVGAAGTYPYMAPENFNKDFGKTGRKSDIWSLGCVLLEMLQGHAPRYYRFESGDKKVELRGTDIAKALSAQEKPFRYPQFNRENCGDTEKFVRDAEKFLDLCLKADASERPTARDLLNHKLITGAVKGKAMFQKLKSEVMEHTKGVRNGLFRQIKKDPLGALQKVVQTGSTLVNTLLQLADLVSDNNDTEVRQSNHVHQHLHFHNDGSDADSSEDDQNDDDDDDDDGDANYHTSSAGYGYDDGDDDYEDTDEQDESNSNGSDSDSD